jgi:hypothetical protein
MGLNDEDIIPSSYIPYYSRGRRLYTRQQISKSEYSRFVLMFHTSHLKSSPSELWTTSCGWRGSMRRNKMNTGNKLGLQTGNFWLKGSKW